MTELRTDGEVRAMLDRVLAGDVAWHEAGRQFAHAMSDEYCDDDRLVDALWTIEGYAWQREQMIDPTALNYAWCKGEWTAEMDAEIVAKIRAILEAV